MTAVSHFNDIFRANNEEPLELEIRYRKLSLQEYLQCLNELKPNTVQASINIINRKNTIIQKSYKPNCEITAQTLANKTEIYSKMPTGGLINVPPFSIKLNIERPTDISFTPVENVDLVRFKIRASRQINDWRIDLTAVRELSFNPQLLQTLRHNLLNGLSTIDKLPAHINKISTHLSNFELEIEFVGNLKTLENPYQAALDIGNHYCYLINNATPAPIRILQNVLKSENTTLKSLLNRAISLTRESYGEIYPPVSYYVTNKADGERAIVIIKAPDYYTLTATTHTRKNTECTATIILDCEKIDDKFYAFDVIKFNDIVTPDTPFTTRLNYLQKCAEIAGCVAKKYVLLSTPSADPKMTSLEYNFKSVLNNKTGYRADGLIITQPDANYLNTANYKWKPSQYQTIDFYVGAVPAQLIGIEPYKPKPGKVMHILFVGITRKLYWALGLKELPGHQITGEYFPVPFTPSIAPHVHVFYHTEDVSGKIVELSFEGGNWVFHRIRDDRQLDANYYGNDFKVAEMVFINYIDPFLEEYLWNYSRGYFSNEYNDIYFAGNSARRIVISHVMKKYMMGAKNVLDLACGRGADLHRYHEIGAKNAVFVDIDATALSELIKRKYNFKHDIVKPMSIGVVLQDLRNSDVLIKQIKQLGLATANVVVCNFAIHYFCDLMKNVRNFVMVVKEFLVVDGLFMFTTMSGARVINKLDIELHENGLLKYSIRRKFKGDGLELCGQVIDILLPMSNGEYRPEPLANIDMLISEFTGFEVVVNCAFSEFMDVIKQVAPKIYGDLTDADRVFMGLYQIVLLKRIK